MLDRNEPDFFSPYAVQEHPNEDGSHSNVKDLRTGRKIKRADEIHESFWEELIHLRIENTRLYKRLSGESPLWDTENPEGARRALSLFRGLGDWLGKK